MFEKYLAGVANQDNLEKFFSSVTFELANRAARTELPYRYNELITKWEISFKPSQNSFLDNNQLMDKKVAESLKRQFPSSSLQPDYSPKKPKTPHTWCGLFNSTAGCSNEPCMGGCVDKSGKEWKHGCNIRLSGGRPCNSSAHSRANHTG